MQRAPAPPQAAMALCVGMHRVPLESMVAPTEAAEMKAYEMLRVTQRGECAAWLWSAVGAPTKKDASHPTVAVQDLPLFNELAAAVAQTRHKRKANQWTDCDGRVLPAVVRVRVRGKDLVLANNTKSLCMHVGHATETLDWFLAQVWEDMGALEAKEKRVTRPPPCDSIPGVAQHADQLLTNLRQQTEVRWASWHPHGGRFRVNVGRHIFKYKNVPRWKTLVLESEAGRVAADEVKAAMSEAVDLLIGELALPPPPPPAGTDPEPANAAAGEAPADGAPDPENAPLS